MEFTVVGEIADIETFAVGRGIRERQRLQRHYGKGRWRATWTDSHGNPTTTADGLPAQRRVEVSLERRKIYAALPDADAARHGQVRIIDESGEDYLFPEKHFAPLELPQAVRRAGLAAVEQRAAPGWLREPSRTHFATYARSKERKVTRA